MNPMKYFLDYICVLVWELVTYVSNIFLVHAHQPNSAKIEIKRAIMEMILQFADRQ